MAETEQRWRCEDSFLLPVTVVRPGAAARGLADRLGHGDTAASATPPRLVPGAYEFSDDRYAPEATVSAFLSEWPRLAVTQRRWRRPAGHPGFGHMGFFKSVGEPLWQEAADWLLARA